MTDTVTRKAESREFLKYPVSKIVGGVAVDPTGDPIAFAFVSSKSRPTNTDWVAGDWEVASGPTYYARILIGAGGAPAVALTAATYNVWQRITDNPEQPVRVIGILKIV